VQVGLSTTPKSLPCQYFYDEEGSELFEAICDLPEYYLTRAETAILTEHGAEIAALSDEPVTLVELGSGSSVKTRILIDHLVRRQHNLRYVPVDISPTALKKSSEQLLADFPGLEILALASEYKSGLELVHDMQGPARLILWLGSNIGNFERPAATEFLVAVRAAMAPADRLLVGVDLRKDATILQPAYDDAQGITARFNLNILAHVNRQLGGHFRLDRFSHRATYDVEEGRVAMYLVSDLEQTVAIDRLHMHVRFATGESVHTEYSYKYSREEIENTAAAADLNLERHFLDAAQRFSLNLLAPI
jgi:L-histidine N-alpha-methyltransferase